MISKAKIKFIRSLEQKKHRKAEQMFIAEGPKTVGDIMNIASPCILVATQGWISENQDKIHKTTELYEVNDETLKKISLLQHPQQVIAVFAQNIHKNICQDISDNKLYIALDGVQDPGNLGTIIRIADWFGIEKIYCSHDTADVWNPKVVQATMGSIARVATEYVNLPEFLASLPEKFPVYGTMLDGNDICESKLQNYGIIVMGNEGNGISSDVAQCLTHKLLIPNYPKERLTADSLNVAIATAITCFHIRNNK